MSRTTLVPSEGEKFSSQSDLVRAGRHRQIAGTPQQARDTAGAPKGAPGTPAKARGHGNKSRGWGNRQPSASVTSVAAHAVQRLDGGGSPNARSFGRPKVQSVPPERGPAGGRDGFPPFAESPSGSGAANSSKRDTVFCWRDRHRESKGFFTNERNKKELSSSSLFSSLSLSFPGCVAQMVERSLRMRQVLGSMPSASMREGRRG